MSRRAVKKAADDVYRVVLDGNWRLSDLYQFPRDFAQCYAFEYCLDTDLEARDRDRIDDALETYPWQGGYSYVNIYNVLQNQVPAKYRPKIDSISYGSPGWIDMTLHIDAAIQVAKAVAIVAGSMVAAVAAYRKINRMLSDIRTDNETAKIDRTLAQARLLRKLCEEMAGILGFEKLEDLHKRTGDPETSLKLLLAQFRRVKRLAEYLQKGKAGLPIDPSEEVSVKELRHRFGGSDEK